MNFPAAMGHDALADEALDAAQLRSPYPSDSLNSVQGDPSAYGADSLMPGAEADVDTVSLPLLGRGTAGSLQKRLLVLLAIGAVVLALMAGSHRPVTDAVAATGQVGVAGAGGQSAGFPGCGGKRRRAGAQRARAQCR